MTTDDLRTIQDSLEHLGPSLQKEWDSEERGLLGEMKQVPVCAVCPAGQWYKTVGTGGDALECFCTQFRGVMYNGGKIVTECDARDDAIARLKPQETAQV